MSASSPIPMSSFRPRMACLASAMLLAWASLAAARPASARDDETARSEATHDDAFQNAWVVLAAVASSSADVDLPAPFERALRTASEAVIDGEPARARFEREVSVAPVELAPDALAGLRAKIQEATQHLALGELPQALDSLREVRGLNAVARDQLHHEMSQARELFEACIMVGYLMHKAAEVDAAEEQLRGCALQYPSFRFSKNIYGGELRALFARIEQELQQDASTLRVRSANHMRCDVRVNGILLGTTPLDMPTRSSDVRVQLECGDTVSRVHRVQLEAGSNRVVIDAVFDQAIESSAPRLSLRYANAETLRALAVPHAARLARVADAAHVLLLEIEGGRLTALRHVRPNGETVATVGSPPSRPGPARASALVERLLASGSAPRTARPAVRDTDEDAFRTELGTPGSPGWSWAMAAASTVTLGASVGIAAHLLGRRADERVTGRVDAYDETRDTLLLGATGFPLLATAMVLTALPEREGVPAWAWAVGGGGVATLGAGTLLHLLTDPCAVGDPSTECLKATRDPLLGPTIMLHSLPLLAVPLTYLLDEAFGGSPPEGGEATSTAGVWVRASVGGLRLGGRF